MVNLPDCCYDYRPERPLAKAVDTCSDCRELIYEGDEYFDIQGMVLCEECMKAYRKTAELDQ